MIVCEDADCIYALLRETKLIILSWMILVDLAVNTAHAALFTHAGQVCFAASRIFVHADIHDQFVHRSVELAKQRAVGDPFDPLTKQGPLVDTNWPTVFINTLLSFVPQISQEQLDRVLEYIRLGIKAGAKLECGGVRVGEKGYFVAPTIFSGVKDEMRIAQEEVCRSFTDHTSDNVDCADLRPSNVDTEVRLVWWSDQQSEQYLLRIGGRCLDQR